MNRSEVIKSLLEKYFDGTTSLNEEAVLREYFSSTDVADEFVPYKPVFSYFEKERKHVPHPVTASTPIHSKRLVIRIAAAAAACILIVMGIFFLPDNKPIEPEYGCTGTYVLIDGECYNDPSLVFSHAGQTLDDLNLLFDNIPVLSQPQNSPAGK